MFDAHFHVIDPRFPLVANNGFLPQPFDAASYRRAATELNVTGGAVVSGSFQAFDQTYLEAALAELGPGFVGVTQLPAEVSDAEILRLDALGIRVELSAVIARRERAVDGVQRGAVHGL